MIETKITWEELEQKLNQEIKEFKQEQRTGDIQRMVEYLEYLKGELHVELFISKEIKNENNP